ncbi:MAG TPA: TonB-dependent receptor [Turneriella sp.]|nr:TonB-dependent receptor [Turneriella sp.]
MRRIFLLLAALLPEIIVAQAECPAGVECAGEAQLRTRRPIRLVSEADKRAAGSYREVPLADAPEAALSERVSDVLQRQSGVQVNRAGAPGTQSLLGVRGASPEQTEYFIEGVPLPRPYAAPLNLETMPLPLFRAVEVYPSFIPAHLAASNIGGALDFRLRRPEGTGYLAQTTASELGGTSIAAARHTATSLHFATIEQSRNSYTYPDNNGTTENTADDRRLRRQNEDYSRLGYTGFGQWETGRWQIGVLADAALTDRGLPGTQGYRLEQVRRREERGATAVRIHYRLSRQQELQSFATASADRMFVSDPAREMLASTGETTLAPQVMSGAGYSLSSGGVSLGIYARARYQNIARNSAFLARRHELQAAASAAYDPGWFRVAAQVAGVGFTDRAAANAFYASAAQEYSGSGVSASALAAFRPLGLLGKNQQDLLELYAQVSSAYRPPSLFERFGDNIFVTPSENLRSEKALTNSAGLRGSVGCPWGMTCSFRSEFWLTGGRDYILFTQNSSRTLVAVNASAAQIYGIESEAMLSLPGQFLLSLRYTWLEARDYGNIPFYQDKYLPLRPRHHFVLTASYLWQSWRFTASGEFRGAVYRDRYNSYQYYQAARLTADAAVDYLWQNAARHTLTLAVRNLTDNQTTDMIGYPLPGRYVLVKWMVEF